jgi:NADH-quinone oxidoreductase subunit L
MATGGRMAVSTGIALLIFCGAMGKSGQVPLHVWLPDAMEGPTPVSALIHAATMVAAGVFLVARVYPLMERDGDGGGGIGALVVMTWVGAFTALFAALVAVAQTDIKRILAYSTVSQLGYMMLGLGTGGSGGGDVSPDHARVFQGVAVPGGGLGDSRCHGEQDIRRMGGLRRHMPVTFATYGMGMLALAGVPLFRGFGARTRSCTRRMAGRCRTTFYLGLAGAAADGVLHDAPGVLRVSGEPIAGQGSRMKAACHDGAPGGAGGVCGAAGIHRHTVLAGVPEDGWGRTMGRWRGWARSG